MKTLTRLTLPALALIALIGCPDAALADEPLRIGFLGTQSGPQAQPGLEQLDAIKLALKEMGNKLGGRAVQLVTADDQGKPDVAVQAVKRMLQNDRIEILTGIQLSNVMLAVAPAVFDANVVLLGTNAGPSALAGKGCNAKFFSLSFQGDNVAEAMGEYLRQKNVKDVAILAPNYAAGHDMLNGFKRFYRGKPAQESYIPLSQFDFSAELTQLAAEQPKAAFAFFAGEQGIAFMKQYAAAGLRDAVPLYVTSFTVDQLSLNAIGENALGILLSSYWSDALDNEANKHFVAAFKKEYGRPPSAFAATAYDAYQLLDAALRKSGGKVDDHEAFLAALASAPFHSVRGNFRFNTNHFPIQDYYLLQVVKDDAGHLAEALRGTIMKDHGDAYAQECQMK